MARQSHRGRKLLGLRLEQLAGHQRRHGAGPSITAEGLGAAEEFMERDVLLRNELEINDAFVALAASRTSL